MTKKKTKKKTRYVKEISIDKKELNEMIQGALIAYVGVMTFINLIAVGVGISKGFNDVNVLAGVQIVMLAFVGLVALGGYFDMRKVYFVEAEE